MKSIYKKKVGDKGLEVNLKNAEWKLEKIEPKSRIKVTENLVVMTGKKYNWFQKRMWKIFFNIDIEKY